jgi:hypothetical protein
MVSLRAMRADLPCRSAAGWGEADLVVTTYSTLSSDYKRSMKDAADQTTISPMHEQEWRRIVFDEVRAFLPSHSRTAFPNALPRAFYRIQIIPVTPSPFPRSPSPW